MLSIVAGFHVPVIPLIEVVGSNGAVAPEQKGAMASNVGTTLGLTVMFKVVVPAFDPIAPDLFRRHSSCFTNNVY